MRAPFERADAKERPLGESPLPFAVHLRYWIVVVLWMGVISYLSTDAFSASNTHNYIDPILRWLYPGITNPEIVRLHGVVRKGAHFAEFFVLGLLAVWAQRAGRPTTWRARWALRAMVVVIVWAALDELHQGVQRNRTPAALDTGIDIAGGAVAQVFLYLCHLVRSRW
jgi:VanZ family protein